MRTSEKESWHEQLVGKVITGLVCVMFFILGAVLVSDCEASEPTCIYGETYRAPGGEEWQIKELCYWPEGLAVGCWNDRVSECEASGAEQCKRRNPGCGSPTITEARLTKTVKNYDEPTAVCDTECVCGGVTYFQRQVCREAPKKPKPVTDPFGISDGLDPFEAGACEGAFCEAANFDICSSRAFTLPQCLSCCSSAHRMCLDQCEAMGESDPLGCRDACDETRAECAAGCYAFCTFGICT